MVSFPKGRPRRKERSVPRSAAVRELIKGVWPDLIAPPQYEHPHKDWVDPALPDFREIWRLARERGYAVGIHGSLKRDVDLIASPWTDDASSAAALVYHISKGINARTVGVIEAKPQGRIAVTLQIDGWFKPIDLSVMPRRPSHNQADLLDRSESEAEPAQKDQDNE